MKRKHALITGLLIALTGMIIMGWAFAHPDLAWGTALIVLGGVIFLGGLIFFASFFKEKE